MKPPRSNPLAPTETACGRPSTFAAFPWVPLALAALLALGLLLPVVRATSHLVATFVGVPVVVAAWTALLAWRRHRGGMPYRVELVSLVKAHYVQGSVQLTLYAYWAWHWSDVRTEAPLIFAQLVFLYALDGLLAWTRGRAWRVGCGLLPIVLSTNVFLWFTHDRYALQFVLIAVALLGKEFVKWSRDGRQTHVFNPSAFTLSLASILLLATDTTGWTRATDIADSFNDLPRIFLVIFGLGLIVQSLFAVTLMTLSAAATLAALGLLYTWSTGSYWFVLTNVSAPVFLGMHLLMTDPATSPRSGAGRVMFGALYGALTFTLYGMLAGAELPTVYDKLLPIPLLNLSVRAIDRFAQARPGSWFQRIEPALAPTRANLVHMGVWVTLFVAWLASGFVQAQHPGNSLEFWRSARAEGRANADEGLLLVTRIHARHGSAEAWNELGRLQLEGRVLPQDTNAAARCFSQASKLGSVAGSANLVALFLDLEHAPLQPAVVLAFDQLERRCDESKDGAFHLLLARAYQRGRGRTADVARARAYFAEACRRGNREACAARAELDHGS